LSAPAFGQTYTITDLGDLGGYYSEAHGINGSGNVVGEFEPTNSFYQHAFYYHNGTNTDIGSLGPNNIYAIAYAINVSNVIVGESSPTDPNVAIRAFVYSDGVMTDLGTLAGTNLAGGYSSAHGVNKLGQIVGESTTAFGPSAPTHAFLYSGGSKTDLGALGGNYSNARGINDSGVIVGESDFVSQGVTNIHAFIYTNGVMQDLSNTLGGEYSSAAAINNAGVIVGEADAAVGGAINLHAFLYRDRVMSDLGTLGFTNSCASAVNSAGQIVGYVGNTGNDLNAFLYNGSTMVNLNNYLPPNSGWLSLNTADGINDAGQITGSGTLVNGDYHAFLLTPSEPFITLSAPAMLTNGRFQLTVEGLSGERFAIQGSTNLTSGWVSLATNTLSGTTTNFIDTSVSNWRHFYRALLLP
jgi:probable HAF family extracellular repeat protein